jgi:hypothetical protein
MKQLIPFILLSLLSFHSFSQQNFWKQQNKNTIQNGYQIQTSSDAYFYFDITAFKQLVQTTNQPIIALPVSKTDFVTFKLTVNTTMSRELQIKFPEIRAFNGISLSAKNLTAKVEIGPDYFRAMITKPNGQVLFIDPTAFTKTEQNNYILYTREQFSTDKYFSCNLRKKGKISDDDLFQAKAIQTCELRTYRAAISATGEYTAFHGGTVAQALAAQVTTLNRVNGIYERDLAITLSLIGNNDLLIYTNASTDPYSNGNPDNMIDENVSNTNNVIGASNYDIGHVFGTDSGGLANLDCVCSNNWKAGGVTGSSAPVGDPFDIDYVSHEMGHQFGADHSFNNSCGGNRNNATAMEPGSGSSIMGYAGVCPTNVQNNSDGYFHAISLQEIGTAVSQGSHTCPVKTPLNNVAPSVSSIASIVNIPAGTPFMLTATATDADGDSLTYCWEQMNNDISTQPPTATATKGPSFRTYFPSNLSTRYFPSIYNQTQGSTTWEKLSTAARSYKFRVTVRDNAAGGGCTDSKDVTFSAIAEAGPFIVTYPSASGIIWTGLTTQTVTWDVANTNTAPISCQQVKISISTDGGATFTTLLANTPNDGSEDIQVPNIATTKAIIMITSDSQTFYDVSDKVFKIETSALETTKITKSKVDLGLYPNPTSQAITVRFDGAETLDGYQIYNSLGQVVLASNAKIKPNTTISLSELSAGIYLFETLVNGQRILQKLIKN